MDINETTAFEGAADIDGDGAASHGPGLNRTTDMVAGKYYWPGLTNDVKAYVSYNYVYKHIIHCQSVLQY